MSAPSTWAGPSNIVVGVMAGAVAKVQAEVEVEVQAGLKVENEQKPLDRTAKWNKFHIETTHLINPARKGTKLCLKPRAWAR